MLFSYSDNSSRLLKNSIIINGSAFRSGIRFAHVKFNFYEKKHNHLNIWTSNGIGLDFNSNGFPIGTSILNNKQQLPISSEQCRQIWQFVLDPVRPVLKLTLNKTGYWTTLNSKNECTYRYSSYKPHIIYQPTTGQITLLE
jgi:hypothetical protein